MDRCCHCGTNTEIKRAYHIAILITLLLIVGMFVLVYYFTRKKYCTECHGTDITDQPGGGNVGGWKKGIKICDACRRPTLIQRPNRTVLMVILMLFTGPFALIYHYISEEQCQHCYGKTFTRVE